MAIAKWIQFGAPILPPTGSIKPEPIPPTNSADAKKFGFENFGNTCYANSVLQALYFCIPFRELLLQSVDSRTPHNIPVLQQIPTPLPPQTPRPKPARKYSTAGLSSDIPTANGSIQNQYPPIPSSPPTLLSALQSLFLYISRHPEEKGVVAPRAFIDKLKEVNELFRSTMHQDAHEFLNYLLNKVAEEIAEEKRQRRGSTPPVDDQSNSILTSSRTAFTTTMTSNSGTSPQDVTLVHKLFEGILTSETRCLTCESVSARDESFLDLSIDIEQNSSVTACLRQFSASEMLCQKNKFFCDACCDLQEAEKRMKIKKLPNILALHLKRFKYQEDVQRYIKLTYRVAFPFELRLFNTVDDAEDADRLYELFAIVIHIGNGPHHGHYISLVKTCGSWLVFDDDIVEPLRESDIPRYFGDSNAGSAYVLYYQAVDVDLVGLGLREHVLNQVDDKVQQPSISSQSSPLLTVPAFPPGLTEEGDASDVSEQLPPAVVAIPPQLLVPGVETHANKAVTKANDSHFDDPPHQTPLPTLTVPAVGGSSTIGGLLQSLRRGPTTKPRTSVTESQKSHTESSPQSVAQPPLPSNEDQTKTASTPPSFVQDKAPERKASTWFKRKGTRSRPESASEHTPPQKILPVDEQTKSLPFFSLPSPATNQTSLHASREEGSHQSQDSASTSGRPLLPPIAFGLGISLNSTHDRRNGYDSPSAGSVSSSFASASATPYPHSDSSTHPYATPMMANMSRGPPSPSPTAMHFLRQQSKSVTQLAHRGKKSFDAYEKEKTPLPKRPLSTSSDAYSTVPLIPPVPPLPPRTSSSSRASESGEARSANQRDRDRPLRTNKPLPAVGDSPGRPMTYYQPAETGSTSNSTAGTTSGIGHAANGLIRVSRKLSLGGPMLGFGRKDKERDKPKDREKGSATPFTSYVPFSMASKT